MNKQEWQTIDQIMVGRAPGSVVLVHGNDWTFTPYYKVPMYGSMYWCGVDDNGEHYTCKADLTIWKLHTPEATPSPAPTPEVERPQLWWFQIATGDWRLDDTPLLEADVRHFVATYKNYYRGVRPSGIYLPEEK